MAGWDLLSGNEMLECFPVDKKRLILPLGGLENLTCFLPPCIETESGSFHSAVCFSRIIHTSNFYIFTSFFSTKGR